MGIIEHGDWTQYDPDPYPPDAPAGVMFARRDSDDQDWYKYVHPPATNFQPNSVRMTVYRQALHGPTVGAAVYDATALWPASACVIEETHYTGSDPKADYGGKLYDFATQTFSDPPPPEPLVAPEIRELTDRIAALEAASASAKPPQEAKPAKQGGE